MTSPSTLIRKARVAEAKGHRSAAKRLREQAAEMRRVGRKKKPRKTTDMLEQERIVASLQKEVNIFEQKARVSVRGPMEDAVDRILGPNSTVEQRIAARRELTEARHLGERNAKSALNDDVEKLKEIHRISTVCGLISIVEHSEKLNGNLPPTMIVSGYMVARVVDALRKAGYTRDGLNGGGTSRENIVMRSEEADWKWKQLSPSERIEGFNR
jgi:hypothetical protein